MEEKKRLTRSNNKMIVAFVRSCGILGYRSDDRTDRVGIDGFLRLDSADCYTLSCGW